MLKTKNDKKVLKTSIVYNSVIANVERVNWRYDFHKVTNVTYADNVRRRNTVKYGNHPVNMGQTLLNTQVIIVNPKGVHIDTKSYRTIGNSDDRKICIKDNEKKQQKLVHRR